jgi:hypothetical protein
MADREVSAPERPLGAGLQFFLEWAVLHFIDEEKRARAELYVEDEVGGDGQCGRDSEQYNCGSQSIDGVADHGNLLLMKVAGESFDELRLRTITGVFSLLLPICEGGDVSRSGWRGRNEATMDPHLSKFLHQIPSLMAI